MSEAGRMIVTGKVTVYFEDPEFAKAVAAGKYNLHWRKQKRYARYYTKTKSKGWRKHVRKQKAKAS